MTRDLPGLLPGLEVVRKDFPILGRVLADGYPLVYLDSANTSQKPQVVIDAMVDHLERHNANVSRAVHQLGAESTEAYEAARDKVAAFLSAPSRDEVIFTRNATEALNLVANTMAWAEGDLAVGPGDEVLITHYTRILRYITPDFVHVFVDGRIAEEGGPELAEKLEAEGYQAYLGAGAGAGA